MDNNPFVSSMASAIVGEVTRLLSEGVVQPTYLTAKQVEVYTGIKAGTLEAWRRAGGGPRYYIKDGKSVRYLRSDVDQFMEAHMVHP